MTRCQEIMKPDVACLSPRDSAQAAAAAMRDENIGFLPICDEGMRVLGTVTDRDIAIRVVAEQRPADTTVGQIMTREVVACHPQDDIEDAKQVMGDHRKSRIMCLDDDGTLVGIISLSDIAKLPGDGAGRTLREVSRRETRSEARL